MSNPIKVLGIEMCESVLPFAGRTYWTGCRGNLVVKICESVGGYLGQFLLNLPLDLETPMMIFPISSVRGKTLMETAQKLERIANVVTESLTPQEHVKDD